MTGLNIFALCFHPCHVCIAIKDRRASMQTFCLSTGLSGLQSWMFARAYVPLSLTLSPEGREDLGVEGFVSHHLHSPVGHPIQPKVGSLSSLRGGLGRGDEVLTTPIPSFPRRRRCSLFPLWQKRRLLNAETQRAQS